jgi:hypothetical protein
MLLDMLIKIAEADGALHERERRILDVVHALYEELRAAEAAAAASAPAPAQR